MKLQKWLVGMALLMALQGNTLADVPPPGLWQPPVAPFPPVFGPPMPPQFPPVFPPMPGWYPPVSPGFGPGWYGCTLPHTTNTAALLLLLNGLLWRPNRRKIVAHGNSII
jgi:hypothetical protein